MGSHRPCSKCGKCHKCKRQHDEKQQQQHLLSSRCSLATSASTEPSCGNGGSGSSAVGTPLDTMTPLDAHVTQVNASSVLGLDRGFLNRPRFQGSQLNVGIARNYLGGDSGSVCVLKWRRASHRCEHGNEQQQRGHLDSIVATVDKAAEIIYWFMATADTGGWSVIINKPRLVRCESDGKFGGRRALMEPFLDGFRALNDVDGWAESSRRTYNKVAQALSHFSYVWSGGKLLLCGLKGSVRMDEKLIILSNPTILSQQRGSFGCKDSGYDGIRLWFANHRCSELCEHMATAQDKKLYFRALEDEYEIQQVRKQQQQQQLLQQQQLEEQYQREHGYAHWYR